MYQIPKLPDVNLPMMFFGIRCQSPTILHWGGKKTKHTHIKKEKSYKTKTRLLDIKEQGLNGGNV